MSGAAPADKRGTVFCRECGKPIEADAHFCRFCGKSQADPGSSAAGSSSRPAGGTSRYGLEDRLRQLFPRHQLQDDFMHIGSITAFVMALIGFILGFFTPPLGSGLSLDFLLGSVALLLFLIVRESTLSHIRTRGDGPRATAADSNRNQATRRAGGTPDAPPEAATAESSPPGGGRPPATPR